MKKFEYLELKYSKCLTDILLKRITKKPQPPELSRKKLFYDHAALKQQKRVNSSAGR